MRPGVAAAGRGVRGGRQRHRRLGRGDEPGGVGVRGEGVRAAGLDGPGRCHAQRGDPDAGHDVPLLVRAHDSLHGPDRTRGTPIVTEDGTAMNPLAW